MSVIKRLIEKGWKNCRICTTMFKPAQQTDTMCKACMDAENAETIREQAENDAPDAKHTAMVTEYYEDTMFYRNTLDNTNHCN